MFGSLFSGGGDGGRSMDAGRAENPSIGPLITLLLPPATEEDPDDPGPDGAGRLFTETLTNRP